MAYVYKISGNGIDYYGSSVQNPVERKAKHKTDYRFYLKQGNTTNRWCCSSNKIFDSYGDGWETGDWTFKIIAEFDTIQEAKEYENLCIINEPCVNTNRAIGLTGDEMRKYKAEWAMNKRREEGVPERTKFETDEERKEAERLSKLKSTRKYRENMSAEEKDKLLEKRRKQSLTEEAKEKNREYLNTPEVKERRRLQQIAKRALKTPEQLAKEAERRKELYQAKKAKA
jgi:hypothetical protein